MVQQGYIVDMLFWVDDIIVYVSCFVILKIGDFFFIGMFVGVGLVSIGQYLEGYFEIEKLFDFYIW